MQKIRSLIVSRHASFSQALKSYLEGMDTVEAVETAPEGAQAAMLNETLGQFGFPGSSEAIDLEDWLQYNPSLWIKPFYVDDHNVDFAFKVQPAGTSGNTVYTNEVTVKRGETDVFSSDAFLFRRTPWNRNEVFYRKR